MRTFMLTHAYAHTHTHTYIGKTGAPEPAFTSLATHKTFEIREYPRYYVATIQMFDEGSKKARSDSFSILAKYIGVFGTPENTLQKKLAMTTPVETKPAIMPRTSPVSTMPKAQTMSFILPFTYTNMDEIPKPTDGRIIISEEPSKVVAVKQYNGWSTNEIENEKLDELITDLKASKLISPNNDRDTIDWQCSQYHPPFTLPYLRRNEIWIKLENYGNYDKVNRPEVISTAAFVTK